MKIKSGFMVREVAEQWIVVPLGQRVVEFNGIISLSECGAFLWKLLEAKDVSEEELISAVLAEYDIDEATARVDVVDFMNSVKAKGLFE